MVAIVPMEFLGKPMAYPMKYSSDGICHDQYGTKQGARIQMSEEKTTCLVKIYNFCLHHRVLFKIHIQIFKHLHIFEKQGQLSGHKRVAEKPGARTNIF